MEADTKPSNRTKAWSEGRGFAVYEVSFDSFSVQMLLWEMYSLQVSRCDSINRVNDWHLEALKVI